MTMPRPLPDIAAGHLGPQPGPAAEFDAWQRIVVGGHPSQVSMAREFVRQVLGDAHPGLERVTLLTSELVTNSVSHSDSRLDGGTVTVTVGTAPDRVRVEVSDGGGPAEPAVCRDDGLAETGRGLRLVEAYALRWGYHRAGPRAVTWFECRPDPLDLSRDSARPGCSVRAGPGRRRWASGGGDGTLRSGSSRWIGAAVRA
jgi:anti-sigma regulatory factor (Ser/Thr protein kinase)